MTKKEPVPVFFSVDDRFIPYLVVAMTSIIKNSSSKNLYKFHVLCTELKKENKEAVKSLETSNVSIEFDDVTDYLRAISDKLPIRDYYSKTTYYRLFIADMFPDYDKVIYLDCDTVVLADIADLYEHDIGDNLLGATMDDVMNLEQCALYAEEALGISRYNYFNAGVLIMNTKQMREKDLLEKFVRLLNIYEFVVAQDQDYLNVICKDHVTYIKNNWDIETCMPTSFAPKDFKIIHYNMATKPWHYADCPFNEYFWKYAKMTSFYDLLQKQLESYPEEEKKKDALVVPFILETCLKEAKKKDNYVGFLNSKRDPERVKIQQKIKELEEEGKFDIDVENDPPSRMLYPNEVDYLKKKLINRIKAKLAFEIARIYLNKMIKKKKIIINDVKGLENLTNLSSGAVITCNHFSPMDSFAIQIAYEQMNTKKGLFKKRKFFRVIKEGNYTSFPGFYGYLMRNCNTLPLSSNFKTMRQFILSTDTLLQEGNLVLFYPEQSLWMNYRKPKPLKKGAFSFASNNRVPVIPVFITMKDSMDHFENGYPIQEYTIHIGKLIYPDPDYSQSENAQRMMEKNYQIWKDIYEQEYQRPLVYTTKKEVLEKNEMLSICQSRD